VKILDILRYYLRKLVINTSKSRTKYNAAYHYDLDGHLYDRMLDDDKQYSCAYYEKPDMTLEEAQLAKKRHLAAKLLIEPGMNVLDIGCGWGGLALYLAEVAQAGKVVGVNLSDAQVAIARKRVRNADLADQISFEVKDYRDSSGIYDRIVSVGFLEHVGPSHYKSLFKTIKRCLKNDGVALIHTIGFVNGVNFTNPWVTKYIFPSGYLPALSELTPAIEQAGLQITDIEVWRLHYVPTLREWRNRFMAHREGVAKIYNERFCRMWEFYLAMAEAAFLYENVAVFQIQLGHAVDAAPLTRDYIEERKVLLREREAASHAPFGRVSGNPTLTRMSAPQKIEDWK
jgi:cyclopropane-fatty-acyl-phospholipid synthase